MIKLKLLLQEGYKYSSTQVDIPETDSNLFLEFSNSIPDEDLYINPSDGSCGSEDNPHISILYGLLDSEPDSVKESLERVKGKITAKLGKVSLFENDKFDVIKVDVTSPSLHKLRELFDSLKHESKFPDYEPHVTLAYVKKGLGDKYVGDTRFEGKSYKFNTIRFSPMGEDKSYTYIKLKD